MGGKTTTISQSEPMLGTLRVQTSMYGLAVPLVWGQTRVTGNLLWFGNFQAVAHTTTQEQGGKGGGGVKQVTTTYSYYAAAMMALARGPIAGVASAWKGKQRYGGAMVPGPLTQRETVVTVTNAGGPVSVPLNGAMYVSNVSAVWEIPGGGYDSGNPGYSLAYREGVDYSQDGAGNYSFAAGGGTRDVTLSYMVSTSGSWLSALGQLGLSLANGTVGQPVWSWLQSYMPSQAVPYSGLAYVYAQSYELTNQAEVENHSFEIVTGTQVGGGVVDAWPQDIVSDALCNPFYGAGWKSSRLAALTAFASYCRARRLWLSPAMTEQRPARDWLEGLAELCNAEWALQGTQLDLVPRGDEAIASEFGAYTPNVTPEFDLVHAEGGDILEPVKIEPVVNEDAKNIIRIQWTNRANGYALEIMEARDAAHIEQFGERPADVVEMNAIHDPAVAQSVCQLILQRQMTVWNRYTIRVPFTRALMSLMSLQTITDADSELLRVPVRIMKRSEAGDLEYEFEAEDAPIGSATAPIYGQQAAIGFAHDYNAAPGNVLQPVIFEAPVQRTQQGLEVLVAVTGGQQVWGGCSVWASFDGTTYKMVGRVSGGARYGTFAAAVGVADTAASVQLAGLGGQLLSGTAADAAQDQTLCWADGIEGGEYFNYVGAALTGPNTYTLSGLVRPAFQNTVQTHALGSKFVRVDNAIVGSGPLDDSFIGQTILFKFTSFNVYGGAEQALSDVVSYPYTVTGGQLKLPPPDIASASLNGSKLSWTDVATSDVTYGGGYQWRYQYGTLADFDTAIPLHSGIITDNPWTMPARPPGKVTLMGKAIDRTGARSRNPRVIYTDLGDSPVANILETRDYKALGWPGTYSGATVSGGNLVATQSDPADSADGNSPADNPDGNAPAYPANFDAMTWESTPWKPSKAAAGSTMTLPFVATGTRIRVEYRILGESPADAADGSAPAWSSDDASPADPAPSDYAPWPGSMTAANVEYQWRVSIDAGSVQGSITAFPVNVDVPDKYLRAVVTSLTAGGTRISAAAGQFNVIKTVRGSLQSGTATGVRIVDYDATLGPLVQPTIGASDGGTGDFNADIGGY